MFSIRSLLFSILSLLISILSLLFAIIRSSKEKSPNKPSPTRSNVLIRAGNLDTMRGDSVSVCGESVCDKSICDALVTFFARASEMAGGEKLRYAGGGVTGELSMQCHSL
jgi:hypothetical protein